jgi:hypothetical protein
LPKYGRIASLSKPTKGPGIEVFFATYFRPSGPGKPVRDATMMVVFSDGIIIKIKK